MAQTGDYILVHFLDNEPAGKTWLRTRNAWPLHITLVPWFESVDKDSLVSILDQIAANVKPYSQTLGNVEQFSEHTTVITLANQASTLQLHERLLDNLELLPVQFTDLQWTKSAYKAHVTYHDGMRKPQVGEQVLVDTFSLVTLLPMNQCRLEKHFTFGSTI